MSRPERPPPGDAVLGFRENLDFGLDVGEGRPIHAKEPSNATMASDTLVRTVGYIAWRK